MKWTIVGVLIGLSVVGVFSEDAPRKKVCDPGTTFMQECNTCRCSADGTLISCTRKFCVPEPQQGNTPVDEEHFNVNENSMTTPHPTANNQVCTPNEVKMDGCNRCKCANNGIGFFCTRKACPPKKREAELEGVPNTPGFRCPAGKSFKYECNTCRCSLDGAAAACTFMACPPTTRTKRDAKGIPNTPGFQCDAGKSFKYNCNNCMCGKDGKSAACTYKDCSKQKRDVSLASPLDDLVRSKRRVKGIPNTPGFKCDAGRNFKYECNTCLCGSDGRSASCTYMLCNPDGTRVRRDVKGIPNTPGFKCDAGKSFKYNCNNCMCGKDGKSAACTYKDCSKNKRSIDDDTPAPAIVKKCKEPTYKKECNTCYCNEQGEDFCTLKGCISKRSVLESPKKDQKCTPGTKFRDADDCNDCFCNDNGDMACTDKLCPKKTDKCVAGTSWNDGCNNCHCPSTGNAVCTERACISFDVPEEKLEQMDPNAPGFTCVAGKAFRFECNNCRCGSDGKTAACTYKFCHPREN